MTWFTKGDGRRPGRVKSPILRTAANGRAYSYIASITITITTAAQPVQAPSPFPSSILSLLFTIPEPAPELFTFGKTFITALPSRQPRRSRAGAVALVVLLLSPHLRFASCPSSRPALSFSVRLDERYPRLWCASILFQLCLLCHVWISCWPRRRR